MEASPSHIPTPQPLTEPSITSCTAADLLAVRSCEVDHAWPHVAGYVERWIEHEPLTSEEVRDCLRAWKAQLWCFVADDSIRGIWITRVERSRKCCWGLIWGCAGDFLPYKDEAIAKYGQIEQWLRTQGCEFVEWSGREGWQRIFPGYERHAVVLRKRL